MAKNNLYIFSSAHKFSLCLSSSYIDYKTGKLTDLQIRVRIGNYFLYFSSKTYVVGTQKNCLDETVLLSTQNTCLN